MNVIPTDVSADPAGMPDDERMTAVELRTVTEALGLDQQWLARHLAVTDRTVRRWIVGDAPIPDGVRLAVEAIEHHTSHIVGQVVAQCADMPDPAVPVLASEAAWQALDMPAARIGGTLPPLRWWRHVTYRAALEVPGLVIADPDRD